MFCGVILRMSYTQVVDNVVFGSEVDAEQLKLLVEDSTVLSSSNNIVDMRKHGC